jgi:hypothetical protein
LKKFIKIFVIVLSLFLPLYTLGVVFSAPPSGWPVTETQNLVVHNSSQESNVTATTFSAATANITTETVGNSAINSLQSIVITAATANITSSTINTSNITNATITTESVTTSTINSLQASAVTATALSANTYTTTVSGVDFSTSVGGYYITNAAGQNFVNFKNPSTPTPTTYSYNTIATTVPHGYTGNVFTQSVYDANGAFIGSINLYTDSSSPWSLIMSSPSMGTLNISVDSTNGWKIAQSLGRLLIYTIAGGGNNPLVLVGGPIVLSGTAGLLVWSARPFSYTSNSYSAVNSGIGITMATNVGQGIYTLTQNNAIMNTGPIYPRNPANVAQTLTQPTIQPVYNNDLAGISYTGWSVTGSGNLSSGVLTVNLGLSFDNANAYKCSANYDGVPTTVAGFLAITRNSGSQFVITSVNSTGGTNTTDANKVQWTCIGY